MKRWGSLYTDYHGKAWWFHLWALARDLSSGIVLGLITIDPLANGGAFLAIAATNWLLIIVFRPFSDRQTTLVEVFTAAAKTVCLSGVTAFFAMTTAVAATGFSDAHSFPSTKVAAAPWLCLVS